MDSHLKLVKKKKEDDMSRLLSVVFALALLVGTSACGMLSHPPTEREKTAGIGALAGGATGAIIGSFAGSAVAGGLFGIPLGALAGYYIGDQMQQRDMRREAANREGDQELAELRAENERLKRQAASREQASSAVVTGQKPSTPAPQVSATDLPPSNVSVAFEFDKTTLNGSSHDTLTPIVAWLKADPERSARVVGYTDSIGSEAYNQKLSERRAQVVRQYFIKNGVGASKISVRGMGESNPIASNDTEAGRERNRRVEVIVNGSTSTPSGR
jgi:outer membrane protein OmpA-like peptidoglycan-associated protein